MFVSAKMHDTLKKPRELLAVAYGIRFPDLAAKSKHHGGDVDLDTMDPGVSVKYLSLFLSIQNKSQRHQIVEADRQRLMAIERLILETICFNFTSKMPFPYVIKAGKELKGIFLLFSCLAFLTCGSASKRLIKFAWRIAIDW